MNIRIFTAGEKSSFQNSYAADVKTGPRFWCGQVLVTQNPVDVDYKALSNAGTWFIGKLQTEQDKNRLLDGLEGAARDWIAKHMTN